ncbi:MAG: phosphoribosylamine--glycine ligase [Verrucomicrobia bacterium]|nr:phosphoribosylamine--glycine ligase [Verrucomicrobiota bacterium]
MKILVVGGGGREHALAWKLRQSHRTSAVFVAPGNAGSKACATTVPIQADDFAGLENFALKNAIDLTVVGPDNALASGIVDRFQCAGLKIFGPNQAAARLESSKSYAKEFMARHGIPSARFAICDSVNEGLRAATRFGFPVVIKADGLALGKGVVIVQSREEADRVLHRIMDDRLFGDAGTTVVVEEYLQGIESSVHALIDGERYCLFPTAQDHKALYDGNHGPNTGGMGAFSPSRLSSSDLQAIEEGILKPFLRGIQSDGVEYKGMLFPGLMLTERGPVVLEFNARFGDPESQAILPRLSSDLIDLLEATIEGRLGEVAPQWSTAVSVCVVLASKGYPERPETGKPVVGLDAVSELRDVLVFHAGTREHEGRILTSGGRVIGITALADSIRSARRKAYDAVSMIEFDGCYFRRDIGSIGTP